MKFMFHVTFEENEQKNFKNHRSRLFKEFSHKKLKLCNEYATECATLHTVTFRSHFLDSIDISLRLWYHYSNAYGVQERMFHVKH